MNAAQRIVLVFGLAATAAICHFAFCEWTKFNDPAVEPIFVMRKVEAIPASRPPARLYPRADRTTAVLAGVVAPLGLLTAAAVIGLGSRSASGLRSRT